MLYLIFQIAKIQKSEKIKNLLTQKGEIVVSEGGSHLTAGPYTVTHCDLSDAGEFIKMCEKEKVDFTYFLWLFQKTNPIFLRMRD